MNATLKVFTVKPALSRIEREFVIDTMRVEKPVLLVTFGSEHIVISGKDYSIVGESLAFTEIDWFESNANVRVYFKHKKRGVFFDSLSVTHATEGYKSIPISSALFKESSSPVKTAFPIATLEVGSGCLRVRPEVWFPVEPVFPDAALAAEKGSQLERLGQLLGMSDHSLCVLRTFTFIERRARKDNSLIATPSGCLVFIDDRAITMYASKTQTDSIMAMERLELKLSYEVRNIVIFAEPAGSLRFDSNSDIVALRIRDIEKEDCRFIFERTYRSRYS